MTMTPERLARLDGPGWVTGSFISDVLVARVERHITMHTFAEQANGWRWNIEFFG